MKLLAKFKLSTYKLLMTGLLATIALMVGLASSSAPAKAAGGFNCDSNAVVFCGASTVNQLIGKYNGGDGVNSAQSIHNIYGFSLFGINSAAIQSMNQTAVNGEVTKSGQVFVGNTLVATNAITAGRQNITPSTEENSNGTIFFVRPPSVSFVSSPLAAFVVMRNGVFQFAILVSCGNPVHATPTTTPPPPPTPRPNYTINKLVAVKGHTNFAKTVTVHPGTHVIYHITIQSTGNAPVQNLAVSDRLPAHIQYVGGTLTRDGRAVSYAANFFGHSVGLGALANGTSTTFSFEAIVGPSDTPEVCTNETLNNSGNMAGNGLPPESSIATVNKVCLPKPVFVCTSLTDQAISRTEFRFTGKANASNGAVVTAYNFNFGDNTTQSVRTSALAAAINHTYAAPGNYRATLSVTMNVDGSARIVTAPACAVTVTVRPAPIAECTDLTLDQAVNHPRMVTANVKFTTSNGAQLKNIVYDWGDGQTDPPTTQTTATHTYQSDGNFTVVATLTFTSPDGNLTSTCQAPISVVTVMPTCDQLQLDVNNDDLTATVSSLTVTPNNGQLIYATLDWGDGNVVTASDITGQTHTFSSNGPFTVVATAHFLVNGQDTGITSGSCQKVVSFTQTPTPPVVTVSTPTTPAAPTSLVNTGPGEVVGLFAAASALGTFVYHKLLTRRLSRI